MSIQYEYEQQIADLQRRRIPLAAFNTPCCDTEMLSPKPAPACTFGSTRSVPVPPWESLQECPFCGDHFHKRVYADGRVDTSDHNGNITTTGLPLERA